MEPLLENKKKCRTLMYNGEHYNGTGTSNQKNMAMFIWSPCTILSTKSDNPRRKKYVFFSFSSDGVSSDCK